MISSIPEDKAVAILSAAAVDLWNVVTLTKRITGTAQVRRSDIPPSCAPDLEFDTRSTNSREPFLVDTSP
ncbi:hypothetical protein HanPSC8_Chr11g0486611 [Helianthus annuus]|nr:hypothetical protein HanPSC8_Chr11g0486611 [Helianthus annuus]